MVTMSNTNKINGSICVPTLNIENKIQPLLENIEYITKMTENICILCPIGLFKLQKICKQKIHITQEYYKTINECYNLLVSSVKGPGFVMAFTQAWSTAKGLSAIIKLQETWRTLDTLVDRKYTYSIAVLSLYLGIFSILLSIFK